jgi:hypothetical protein
MAIHEEERPDAADDDLEIEPWHEPDLLRDLAALRSVSNTQRRGYKLESLLERMFRRAHYQVVHNPRMARPRQTDFAVISHSRHYLVEAKWERRPAGSKVVDAVRSRLGRLDGTVVALLCTMSGITEQADEAIVGDRRDGLVLVFDEVDILRALSGRLMLIRDGHFDPLCPIRRQRAQPEMPGSSTPTGPFPPLLNQTESSVGTRIKRARRSAPGRP